MNRLIMPVEIKLDICKPIQELYTKNSEPIVDIRKQTSDPFPHRRITERFSDAVVFDREFFLRVISICTIKEITDFYNEHPNIKFFTKGNTLSASSEFTPLSSYLNITLKCIKDFADLMLLSSLYRNRDAKAHDDTLDEIYSLHERLHQSLGQKGERIYSRAERIMRTLHDAAAQLEVEHSGTRFSLANPVIENGIVTGIEGDLSDENTELLFRTYKETVIADTKDMVAEQIMRMTENNYVVHSIDPCKVEIVCPTLLSALYAMLSVAEFNEQDYRECQHPKCHRFFLVDKSHPQSRCPEHMASRQTRRQNEKVRKYKKGILSNIEANKGNE